MVMTSCRDLDSTRSALSATSAFAIATAGANEGTPTKEKYRRMSLASAGTCPRGLPLGCPLSPQGFPSRHTWLGRAPRACSRLCPGGLGTALPKGCAAHSWPQVSHVLLTQQLRVLGVGVLLWQPWSGCEPLLRELCCAEGPLAVSGFPTDQRNGDKEFVIRRAATNRVLNVLRHWVSKHSQVGTPRAPSLSPSHPATRSSAACRQPRCSSEGNLALRFG